MKKNILLLIIVTINAYSASAYTASVNGIEWYYSYKSKGGLYEEIRIKPNKKSDCTGSVSIPSKINGATVVEILDEAFSGCAGMTSVSIPSSVTDIGIKAFYGCSGLGYISIPPKVDKINRATFMGCSAIRSISIPSSIKTLDSGAFSGCKSITELTIPATVENMYSGAFSDCTGLKELRVSEGIKTLTAEAFSGCTNLQTIVLPSSMSSSSGDAFEGCKPTTITVPGWKCCINCTKVQRLTITEGTTNIVKEAFKDCDAISEVTIPSSVTTIGDSAFYGCDSLGRVRLSEGLSNIGNYAFDMCCNLEYITLPKSIRSLGSYSFAYCTKIRSLELPDGLTTIGNQAFTGCSISSVTIPRSVDTIESGAFYDCANLSKVVIKPGVSSIKGYAFYLCKNLTSITIPASITEIGCVKTTGVSQYSLKTYVFQSCNKLETVYVEPGKTSFAREGLSLNGADVSKITIIEIPGALMGSGITSDWSYYFPDFSAKFGTDFWKALLMPSGKIDESGNDMLVWHDYVSGTDPTDVNSRFAASISMVDGAPRISWTPRLQSYEEAKRQYRVFAKKRLDEAEWTDVSDMTDGQRAAFTFFKVKVQMR